MPDPTIQELVQSEENQEDKKAEFADKFKNLAKEYGINKYVFVIQDNEDLLTLSEPNDIITTTRMLKIAHSNFYRQILMQIGEGQ